MHALIGGALLMIVGTQVLALGLCAHAYGTYFMGEKDPWFDRMRARFRLEHGLLLGGVFMLDRAGDGRGDRRDLDLARFRLALRGTAGGGRRVAVDRRHPDLLLLVPALDSRSASAVSDAAPRARVRRRARRPESAPALGDSKLAGRGASGVVAGGGRRCAGLCADRLAACDTPELLHGHRQRSRLKRCGDVNAGQTAVCSGPRSARRNRPGSACACLRSDRSLRAAVSVTAGRHDDGLS